MTRGSGKTMMGLKDIQPVWINGKVFKNRKKNGVSIRSMVKKYSEWTSFAGMGNLNSETWKGQPIGVLSVWCFMILVFHICFGWTLQLNKVIGYTDILRRNKRITQEINYVAIL